MWHSETPDGAAALVSEMEAHSKRGKFTLSVGSGKRYNLVLAAIDGFDARFSLGNLDGHVIPLSRASRVLERRIDK